MSPTNTEIRTTRCPWATTPLGVQYHDLEWGVPQHNDRVLFEFLVLEGAQAGLSWSTILPKRDNYRRAFDHFDARKVARYDARKVTKLLADTGIVRNRLKIAAAIQNAKAFLPSRRNSAASTPISGVSSSAAPSPMPGGHSSRSPQGHLSPTP